MKFFRVKSPRQKIRHLGAVKECECRMHFISSEKNGQINHVTNTHSHENEEKNKETVNLKMDETSIEPTRLTRIAS